MRNSCRIRLRLNGIVPPAGTTLPEGWVPGDALLLTTTLGRALFNEILPEDYPYVNTIVGKGEDRVRLILHAHNTEDDVVRLVGSICAWACKTFPTKTLPTSAWT